MGSSESNLHQQKPAESAVEPLSSVPIFEAMATEITSRIQNLNVKSQPKDINILLLGETGVGKSTFINSLFNYLQHESFIEAEKNDLNVLIPSTFSIYDKDEQIRTVTVGKTEDTNEHRDLGVSATQEVRTYTFIIKNGEMQIRLIDTPGMGDTRGINQDHENCENILNYIGKLQELHAICYLCRPQQTRATVFFGYCVAQIMSRLHADASKNFVFVFTGTKGNNYTPGDTYQMLKKLTDDFSKKPAQAKILLDDNKFCFDNEAFRYLGAVKQGFTLKKEIRDDAIKSWTKATIECWNMIDYITKLKPHHVKSTSAINEARRIIYHLSQPMADIAQLVHDNLNLLDRHKATLKLENISLNDLKKKLYIPTIDLKVTKLTQPVTVCADIKCSEIYKVGEKNEWHYKTRCHDPCYLTNVQHEVLGAPELINCASIKGPGQTCSICGCSYKVHMHVYYMTKKEEVTKQDTTILSNIHTREQAIQESLKVIRDVEARKALYEKELDFIVKCNAKFAHFLQRNAIAAFSDSYEEYIHYLILREKSLGRDCDISKLTGLEKLLREHQAQKKIFEEAAKQQQNLGLSDAITPQSITDTMTQLFKLQLSGNKIRGLYDSKKTALKKEYAFTEYKHTVSFTKLTEKKASSKESNHANNRAKSSNSRDNTKRRNKSRGRDSQRDTSPPPSYERSQRQQYQPRRGPSVPPEEYRSGPNNSSRPTTGYRSPPADYRPPPSDYRAPSADYRQPPADYRPPPADYRPLPPADYRPPPAEYRPPPADYRPPPADYRPPPADYRHPPADYRPPPADYRPPPSADYRSPPADYRPPPPADSRPPPPGDSRPPPPAHYRSPPPDYYSHPGDYRPSAADYRPPPPDYRPPPVEYLPHPHDYHPPPPDHRPPPADYRHPYSNDSYRRSPPPTAHHHYRNETHDHNPSQQHNYSRDRNQPNNRGGNYNNKGRNNRGGRGGIQRNYRKKNNNKKNGGSDSDESVASKN